MHAVSRRTVDTTTWAGSLRRLYLITQAPYRLCVQQNMPRGDHARPRENDDCQM